MGFLYLFNYQVVITQMRVCLFICCLSGFWSACQTPTSTFPKSKPISVTLAHERANRLGKGMNYSRFSWYWSAPSYRSDFTSTKRHQEMASRFRLLKKLGFSSVRVAVDFNKWRSELMPNHPFWQGVDAAVQAAKAAQLILVLDYHYGKLDSLNYVVQEAKLIRDWQQIAKRYARTATDSVYFELFNEPEQISNTLWRNTTIKLIREIRKISGNEKRTLVVGGNRFNALGDATQKTGLLGFEPFSEENIIYTFHFYEPWHFTHQAIPQANNAYHTKGVPYPCASEMPKPASTEPKYAQMRWKNYCSGKKNGEKAYIWQRFGVAHRWAKKHNVPVWIGEWGVYRGYVDAKSLAQYTSTLVRAARYFDMNWAYWDMECVLSPFDPVRRVQEICEVWQTPMRRYTTSGFNPDMKKWLDL